MLEESQQPGEIFYFYAEEDEQLRAKLDKHLSQLKQDHQIVDWYPQKVLPGGHVPQETETHLNAAQIILLLISSDFLTDTISSSEIQRALARGRNGSAQYASR